jgi:hypothetical protein
MTLEKFTVIFSIQDAGAQPLANWKAGEVVTKAGSASTGYINANPGTLLTNEVQEAKVVTIEAESAEEAAEAVRIFYTGGPTLPGAAMKPPFTSGGMVNGKMLAGKSPSEVNAIP